MSAVQQVRLRELPVEEPEAQIISDRRVETPERKAELALPERLEMGSDRAPDAVQVLGRGRELMEQERFVETDPAAQWTIQQYGQTPYGEPWFALQKEDAAGELRTVTGTREELDKVVAEHGLTPLELPPVADGSYYRQAVGGVDLEPEIRREASLELSV